MDHLKINIQVLFTLCALYFIYNVLNMAELLRYLDTFREEFVCVPLVN